MSKHQLIIMCRNGILDGDLETWQKDEIIDEIISVEYPEGPAVAGLTPIGDADPAKTWQAIRTRSDNPWFQQDLAYASATADGRLRLEQARRNWASHGLEPPWPAIVPVAPADAVPAGHPATVPEGTTASRCTRCGETRLSYPGDQTDQWKHHADHCTVPEITQ